MTITKRMSNFDSSDFENLEISDFDSNNSFESIFIQSIENTLMKIKKIAKFKVCGTVSRTVLDKLNSILEISNGLEKISPFGDMDKMETVVDKSVRNSLEIDASELGITNEIVSEFNIIKNTKVVPDKILLYEKGSFFDYHKDTPKSDTMIGTIVLCILDNYEGGELVVRDKSYKLKKGEWCFFYGDEPHKVNEITEGKRVVITFKVYEEPEGHKLLLTNYGHLIEDLYNLNEKMSELKKFVNFTMETDKLFDKDPIVPNKLVVTLFHSYQKKPTFENLRGADKIIVKMLRSQKLKKANYVLSNDIIIYNGEMDPSEEDEIYYKDYVQINSGQTENVYIVHRHSKSIVYNSSRIYGNEVGETESIRLYKSYGFLVNL